MASPLGAELFRSPALKVGGKLKKALLKEFISG